MENNLIKSTNNLSNKDMLTLREKFISEYARKKGWDKNNLSPNQLLEIVQSKGYSNPSIIKSKK